MMLCCLTNLIDHRHYFLVWAALAVSAEAATADNSAWRTSSRSSSPPPSSNRKQLTITEITDPMSDYRYSAHETIDPFTPPLRLFEHYQKISYDIPVTSPLQDDLTNLELKGVWEFNNGTKQALIVTRNGEGIIAKVDDPIGPAGK